MDEKELAKTPKGAMMSVVHDAGVISPIVDDDASRLVPAADLLIDDNSPRFLCCCSSCHVTVVDSAEFATEINDSRRLVCAHSSTIAKKLMPNCLIDVRN